VGTAKYLARVASRRRSAEGFPAPCGQWYFKARLQQNFAAPKYLQQHNFIPSPAHP